MSERMDTLQQYVSDMVAVQKHLLEAIERQAGDDALQDHTEARSLIVDLERTLKSQVRELESRLEGLGGDAASPVKKAGAAVLGTAAGVVDMLRTQTVSKMLRDDYTALSLSAISYTMLHTTALALSDQETADLALRHLKGITPVIVTISEHISHVVAAELHDDAESVDTTAGAAAAKNAREAWDGAWVHRDHQHA